MLRYFRHAQNVEQALRISMDHSDKSVSHFGMRKCVYSSLKHEVSIQAHQKKYIRLRVFTDIVIKYFNPRCPFFAPQAVSELSTCGFFTASTFCSLSGRRSRLCTESSRSSSPPSQQLPRCPTTLPLHRHFF